MKCVTQSKAPQMYALSAFDVVGRLISALKSLRAGLRDYTINEKLPNMDVEWGGAPRHTRLRYITQRRLGRVSDSTEPIGSLEVFGEIRYFSRVTAARGLASILGKGKCGT